MKYFYKYIFLFGCSFANVSLSAFNNADSLFQLLENYQKQDTKRVNILIDIAELYREEDDYSKLDNFFHEIIQISEKTEYAYGEALGHYYAGHFYIYQENQFLALEHLNKALYKAEILQEGDQKQLVLFKIHRTLGAYYYRYSMLPEALAHTPKSLEIAEQLKNSEFIYYAKINQAVLYAELKDYSTAIQTLLSLTDSIPMQSFYRNYNLGGCYLNLNQPDSALIYYNAALNDSISNVQRSLMYSKIGESYYLKKDYETAKNILKKSLEYQDTTQKYYFYTQPLTILSSIYLALNDLNTALYYIDLSIASAIEHHLIREEADSRKIKSEILEKKGLYKESLKETRYLMTIKDSLAKITNIEKANTLLLQNELKIKEMQHEYDFYQEQEHHIQSQRQLFFIIVVLVLTIMVILLFLSRKSILLKNKQISEEILTQKLENSNKELTSNVMQQLKTKELLSEVKEDLVYLKKKPDVSKSEINTIVRKMNFSMKDQASWNEFDMYFIQTHQSFYHNLSEKFPDLTVNDKRLCAMLRLNLTTKEISTIINIKPDSVHAARTRLRKKLNLGMEESLSNFLQKY